MKHIPPAKYWMDGKLVRADRACLPLTDLTVTRGYGAFEAFRTYGGKPFLMEQHLKRLGDSCRHLCLKPPLSAAKLRAAVLETLSANRFPESLIRIFVTGGDATGFVPEEGRQRLLILIGPAKLFPAFQYEEGIAVRTTSFSRSIRQAKTIDYTVGIRETSMALKAGFHEVVFVDEKDRILEGTQFSVVAVKGRRLISAEAEILPGVTAEHILKLARREGFAVERRPITRADLRRADEVFITSTNRELIPVRRVDDLRIGSGRPGPVGRLLHRRFRENAGASDRRGE